MQKKRITLIISSLTGGGAENICITIANSFAQNGWIVDLVVLNLKDEVYRNRISDKVNLVVLNVNRSVYSFLHLLKYLLKNHIKTILVFNHEIAVILIILRFFFRLNIKIISRNISVLSIKIEHLKFQNFWTRFIVSPFIKYFYHKIDFVINQCQSMHEDLLSIYPQLKNNSSVIYNPISPQIEDYSNKFDLNKIKKKDYLLCVGRLEHVKAFHYAIEGFAKISSEFPSIRLKIVGQGSLERELKQKASECKVLNKVDFEGFQKDIIPFYLHAKATVLTSIYEGYPNALIESITLNTPVVAFNSPGGTHEIIKDGQNGFLVKYKDIDDLKNKLSTILLKKYNFKDLRDSIKKNQIKNVFIHYEKLIKSFI